MEISPFVLPDYMPTSTTKVLQEMRSPQAPQPQLFYFWLGLDEASTMNDENEEARGQGKVYVKGN